MCVDKFFFESDRLASIHASTHIVCFEPVVVARPTKKVWLVLCSFFFFQNARAFCSSTHYYERSFVYFLPKRFKIM